MAHVRANHWGRDFWENQFNSLTLGIDTIQNYFWDGLWDLWYADIISETNTKLVARGENGGSITVYGQNLMSFDESRVLITQLDIATNQLSLTGTGQLRIGGYLDFYGVWSEIKAQGPAGSMIAKGHLEYGYYGDIYVRNTTETITLSNGIKVVSKTDAKGDLVSHVATVGPYQLNLEGRWAYDSIDTWEDIFRGDDVIHGTDGNDYLMGFSGNDIFYGGGGTDTVMFRGNFQDYVIESRPDSIVISDRINSRDGANILVDIERFAFNDGVMALDVGPDGTAGKAYRIYQAAFDRTPDSEGLGYWIEQMDRGVSLNDVALGFVNSFEFMSLYGVSPSNELFLTRLYQNVLGRQPEAEGYNYWLNRMNSEEGLQFHQVLAGFSESLENQQNVLKIVGDSIFYDMYLG